jgi:hypothetical protein
MVLVYALSVIDAAIQLRDIVLRKPNQRLNVHEYVKSETETRVRRLKVFVAWSSLVHLDDDEAGCQRRCAQDVEEEVGEGAGALLLGRMRGLEYESCLDGEEEAGLVGYQ